MAVFAAAFGKHRARIARLTFVVGAGIVGSTLWKGMPQPIQLEFDLGPGHERFTEVRVSYVQGGEELQGVAFSFPNGAPTRVRHSIKLPAGEFEVHTELRPQHGESLASIRPLHAPSTGLVHIRLPERAQ